MVEQSRGRSPEAVALRERLDGVLSDVDALVGRFEALGDAQRWDALAAVGELARAAEAAVVRVAGVVEQCPAAFDAPSGSRWFGYRSTRDALRHEVGVSMGRAKAIVRVALSATPRVTPTGLPLGSRLPVLADAMREGRVGVDQARVIVEALDRGALRIAEDDVRAAEVSLVADAIGGPAADPAADPATNTAADSATDPAVDPATEPAGLGVRGYADVAPAPPEQLASLARVWLAAFDPDGAEPREERQQAERSFTLARSTDGMFRGRVVLPPEQGARVHAVLSAYRSPRTRRELDVEGAPPPLDDDRTDEQRAADVLDGVFAAHARSGEPPRPGGDAPTLLVTVTQADLDRHAAGEPASCEIVETGELVPAALAARIVCDGFVRAALVGEDGEVLRLGRRKRLFSLAQRLAIVLRDRVCQGCGGPASWSDVHHVRRWADGGPTDIDNGVLVCRRCHTAIHTGRLVIEAAGHRWRILRAILPPIRRRRGDARSGVPRGIERAPAWSG